MKRLLRCFVCVLVSFVAVYLSGYGNIMNDTTPSLAAAAFIGGVVVLSILVILLLEMYLYFKEKINELSEQINKLIKKDKTE